MKVYILTPKKWNSYTQQYESDLDAIDWEKTYAAAKRVARKQAEMYGYDRVTIERCNVRRSMFNTKREYEEACNNDVMEYVEWIEAWTKDGQRPVVVIDGKPVMRWNMMA